MIRKCSDSMEKITAGYLAVCTYQMMSQTLEEMEAGGSGQSEKLGGRF
ncbi:MAG: hypothetical protein V8S12_00185 [Lachnospiraceae bacterium]